MIRRGPVHIRMRARDTTEAFRASSPLEALYDLVFVVAVGSLVAVLAPSIEHGTVAPRIIPFLLVFFAIWWAWINFTWFASAYDTDDVVYRLLAVLQMAGVLVLAAGVPNAFAHDDFAVVTLGYVIMRLGQIALWVRAAIEHPEGRPVALRYGGGVLVVQILWCARLLLPDVGWLFLPTFLVLVVLEFATPLWAERGRGLAWHPHHIAERYALFVLILLGETVLAAVNGLHAALAAHGVTAPLVTIAIAGFVLLVALWWAYFLQPAGEGLARRRQRSFVWGYGHYLLFAALAAVGAALDAAVQVGARPAPGEQLVVGLSLAVPAGAALLLIWALHAPLLDRPGFPAAVAIPAAVLVLGGGALAPVLGIAGSVVAIALVAAASVATAIAAGTRAAPAPVD
ncbi:low temperature requirement protein A [Pseudolysinimonas kribbensis]|uniref:low temperature requirement protein A n=1 Tax=Pseudolysinimonas kribbensis TaxID=433641 RepID=UPI0031D99287